jgi:TolB-like protein
MRDDEEATIQKLTVYRTAMTNLIQQYRGRLVDAPGDNLLAEFGSVVDAVNCAVEIQRELAERNAELPEERRMKFRIGVNLGDVYVEGGRIYGDGVNIAARMESLAEAGGICISGTVYDSIVIKLGLEYDYLGEQSVKNIPEPIRSYRVLSYPGAAAHRVAKVKKTVGRTWRNMVLALTAVVIVGAAVAAWYFYFRSSTPPTEIAAVENMAFPLPDKPSIAVLPFANLSDDPNQEYFTDGLTDDLITDLSQISGLFIIARNSTFAYKGKPVKIKQVAEELGVRYVLEGSVRKAANQVRINAQLIDATTGHHLWAKRYDGKMGDVFALQDKITRKIVTALAVKLTVAEQEHVTRKKTDNIEAYDAFLKGWEHYRRLNPDDSAKAVTYFKKAIELEPNYGRAYAALALTYYKAFLHGWHLSLALSNREAILWTRQYLQMAMKKPTSIAHALASELKLRQRLHQEAIAEAEQAIALDPSDPYANSIMAYALIMSGRPEESIAFVKKAMRLDPHNPADHLNLLGLAHFAMGQLEEAVALIERTLTLNPEASVGWGDVLAAAYGLLGRDEKARDAYWKAGLVSGTVIQNVRQKMYYWPFKDPEVAERFASGLLKTGKFQQFSGYYKLSEDDRLSGEEIKALVFGRMVCGSDGCIDRTKQGQATYHVMQVSESGRSWVEGDMLCNQWKTRMKGLKYCAPVFRNYEATAGMLNDYLSITDYGFTTFSPVD